MWNLYIYKKKLNAELHIYGLKSNLNKKNLQNYQNIGIKFFGIVNKRVLEKKYSCSKPNQGDS